MKVLVAGGAGYIGSNMVRKLIEEKHSPVVLDDLSTGHKRFVPAGVPLIQVDLKDFASVRRAFSEHHVDAVMHFAAASLVGESVTNPLKYYDNNFAAAIQLVKAMMDAGVHKLIFSSTAATFGEPERLPIEEDDRQVPTNPYGWSKLMIERMLRDVSRSTDFRFVALRYFNAAGAHPSGEIGEMHDPETHLIPNILKVLTGEKKELEIFGGDYETPDGTCLRDYVHIEDLATAHLAALEALMEGMKSDVFNLGSGEGYSVKQIVEMVEKVTGKKVIVKMSPRRPGDPARLVASSAKARRVLGWQPKHGLESIIRTAWKWEQTKRSK